MLESQLPFERREMEQDLVPVNVSVILHDFLHHLHHLLIHPLFSTTWLLLRLIMAEVVVAMSLISNVALFLNNPFLYIQFRNNNLTPFPKN